jgi:hypothetical protein
MDKATILSDATRYVKELQEKLKVLEDGDRSIKSWVLVKKPCIAVPGEDSSPSSWTASPGTPVMSRNPLPEIETLFLEKSVMVRIHCEDGKGVAATVLAAVDELHLSTVHANVTTFAASTVIITITAKASFHFPFVKINNQCGGIRKSGQDPRTQEKNVRKRSSQSRR